MNKDKYKAEMIANPTALDAFVAFCEICTFIYWCYVSYKFFRMLYRDILFWGSYEDQLIDLQKYYKKVAIFSILVALIMLSI
jgi:hypothetical protein